MLRRIDSGGFFFHLFFCQALWQITEGFACSFISALAESDDWMSRKFPTLMFSLSSSMKSRRLRPIVSVQCSCTYRCRETAPSRPAAIASMANFDLYKRHHLRRYPVRKSVSQFISKAPPFGRSSTWRLSSICPQSIACPTEKMTWRHGTVTVSFSSYSGENLPRASNTRVHFLKTTPLTWPSSSRTSFVPSHNSARFLLRVLLRFPRCLPAFFSCFQTEHGNLRIGTSAADSCRVNCHVSTAYYNHITFQCKALCTGFS